VLPAAVRKIHDHPLERPVEVPKVAGVMLVVPDELSGRRPNRLLTKSVLADSV
jgi:hypothetical protein